MYGELCYHLVQQSVCSRGLYLHLFGDCITDLSAMFYSLRSLRLSLFLEPDCDAGWPSLSFGPMVLPLLLAIIFPLKISAQEICNAAAAAIPAHNESKTAISELTKLGTQPCFRMDFSQTKILPEFKKPIEASGSMTYVKGQGILWTITEPLVSRTLIRSEGLYDIALAHDGKPMLSLLDTGPTAQFFLTLYSGDEKAIGKYFKISEDAKSVSLVPLSAALASRILKINLHIPANLRGSGSNNLGSDLIEIFESEFSRTSYRPARIEVSPLKLSALEGLIFSITEFPTGLGTDSNAR